MSKGTQGTHEIKEYTAEIENLFLQFFVSEPELFVRCMGIIKPDHYDDVKNKKVVKLLMEHTQQYAALPSLEQIKALAGKDLEKMVIREPDVDWFLNEYETFSRYKELSLAIFESPDLLEEHRYGEVESLIKAAVSIGLVKDLGLDYFGDPMGRLDAIANGGGATSTGFKTVDDKLYGGFNRGELNVVAGQSGAGKSIFLQNFAINWVEQGLNVVYLSLELSENLCAMRIDAMFTDYGTKDILKNRESVDLKLRTINKKNKGTLRIKQLKNGCTANDIKAYIKEYETQTGVKVDAIALDYLDLCMPTNIKVSPSDLFVKDKYVSENLRDLAIELKVLFVTASQLNRCLEINSVVVVENKGDVAIKNVKVGDRILSSDGFNTVTTVYPVVSQDVYRIKTASGKEIICSAEHIFPTNNKGETKISSGLCVGDVLYVNK